MILKRLFRLVLSPRLLCASAPLLTLLIGEVQSELQISTTQIAPLEITAHTGMKPQSKLWHHDDLWWGCFADSKGTYIWRLDEDKWTRTMKLTSDTDIRADVLSNDLLLQVLFFQGVQSKFARYVYSEELKQYNGVVGPMIHVTLDEGVETATIASNEGEVWIASDSENEINVRWLGVSDQTFSDPITLAEGISKDDICVIASLGIGGVGVLWSNQNTQRYGFRRHVPASEPHNWFPDEVPAGPSAIDHGDGMSDDHLNVAVSSDGTLYATVKTSYDTKGMPLVACLIRRPHHRWDPLYHVDDEGSRGIMVLDEKLKTFHVIYTSYRDSTIVAKSSSTDSIAFSDRVILMEASRINNVSATRQNVLGMFPLVASQGDTLMHTTIVKADGVRE
jgi:hypothetical protein